MKTCLTRFPPLLVCLAGAPAAFAQCEVTSIGNGGPFLDYFGGHLAADGDVLVVGIEGYNTPSFADAGAVRVFTRQWQGAPWVQGQLLTEGASAATNNNFGRAV